MENEELEQRIEELEERERLVELVLRGHQLTIDCLLGLLGVKDENEERMAN
jgi:hypothetical protein